MKRDTKIEKSCVNCMYVDRCKNKEHVFYCEKFEQKEGEQNDR